MNHILTVPTLLYMVASAQGHGRLMDPPARNSMWRFGFPNSVNYNDNELFCGGWAVQWEQNEGKCGTCGDPYHVPKPRPHEAGGQYAKGIISRHYSVGQDIDIEVELTANHYGRFQILLCPNNNPITEAAQECFNKYPLEVVGSNGTYFVIPEDGVKKAIFRYQVRLPPYVTCTQCVLQWSYYTGNQWGECSDGSEAQGCGRSEQFRNCADVSIITSSAVAIPPLFIDGSNDPFLLFYRDTMKSSQYNVFPMVIRDQVCVPNQRYRIVPGVSDWCQSNCLRYPPNCPPKVCQCPTTCEATGKLRGLRDADLYCMDKCLVYPSKCPNERCTCYDDGL